MILDSRLRGNDEAGNLTLTLREERAETACLRRSLGGQARVEVGIESSVKELGCGSRGEKLYVRSFPRKRESRLLPVMTRQPAAYILRGNDEARRLPTPVSTV